VVKPNREELGRTLHCPIDSEPALHAAMRELNHRGAEWVVVTQGKDRVWICSANRLLSIHPPRMEAINPIGSGDSLAAGIAAGLEEGYHLPDAVAWGVAAAAENVRTLLPARFARADVQTRQGTLSIETHDYTFEGHPPY
jgi:fructose-1-phosphate kinase PfkB-like protein